MNAETLSQSARAGEQGKRINKQEFELRSVTKNQIVSKANNAGSLTWSYSGWASGVSRTMVAGRSD